MNKLNLQYTISYLGLIPYFIILVNKYLLLQIEEEITFNFVVYYTLVICVFIGSTNWNLEKNISNLLVIYGFLPSIFAVIMIILNLYTYDIAKLFLLLIIFLTAQLLCDYILIFSKLKNQKPFYFLRLPLTILIILTLMIL
tara:strand:+ start:52 stop:474 length:423 start_codon:yes stop_codon:yes gene_type:complete